MKVENGYIIDEGRCCINLDAVEYVEIGYERVIIGVGGRIFEFFCYEWLNGNGPKVDELYKTITDALMVWRGGNKTSIDSINKYPKIQMNELPTEYPTLRLKWFPRVSKETPCVKMIIWPVGNIKEYKLMQYWVDDKLPDGGEWRKIEFEKT